MGEGIAEESELVMLRFLSEADYREYLGTLIKGVTKHVCADEANVRGADKKPRRKVDPVRKSVERYP